MSSNIPAEWTNTFNIFDERHVEHVTRTDCKHIMRSLGRRHTEAEFKTMFDKLGSDDVSYEQFVKMMREPYNGPTEDDLLTALKAFDHSNSGKLSLEELITLVSSLGEKMNADEVRSLFSEMNTDGEGKVSIDNLTKFLTSPTPMVTPEIAELQQKLAERSEEKERI